jgi:hypothetical protein
MGMGNRNGVKKKGWQTTTSIYIESGKCGAGKGGEMSAKALKDAAKSEHKMDKQFRAFKKRVTIEPEQVMKGKRREREGPGGGEGGRERELEDERDSKYSIILLF